MLGWDAATFMPPGGGAARGDQLAVLAVLRHAHLTAPEVEADLAAAETTDPWEAANLSLMRRGFARAKALPADLVEAQAKANSACEKVWRVARHDGDFSLVEPHLAEVLRLTREAAAVLASALGLRPYDALMDGYQPGIGADDVAPIFSAYEEFLSTALPEVEARQARQPAPIRPAGPFPVAAQEALCRDIAQRLGLDFDHARLDQSAHPFSGGTPSDVRITTRYLEDDFASGILAVVHETGHALYERGLPSAYARQPVGEAAGMATHESQSLIVEMQAFRSDAFLGWLGGRLHAAFGGVARTLSAGEPGTALAARGARLHSGRCRRTDLSCPRDPALPTGKSYDCGRPNGRGPARRMERRAFCSAGHHPAERYSGLSAGHPLVRWRVWLFPELHARRDGGRAIDGRRRGSRCRAWTRRSDEAILGRFWRGFGFMYTASEAALASRKSWSEQRAGRSIRSRFRRTCGGAI